MGSPAYIINFIDALIFSVVSVLIATAAIGKWGKLRWGKLLIASVILSLVTDLAYLLFVYFVNSSLDTPFKGSLIWGNFFLTTAAFVIVGYFVAKNYFKFEKKNSLVFAIAFA